MKSENEFLIIWLVFMFLCLVASLLIFTRGIENTNKLVELNNQKEQLEIENNQLRNIYESIK